MVVVPEQTRRLVERVVDLGLADVQVGIDDPVDVEGSVCGARTVEGPGVEEAVARSEPSEGSTVARPRHQAAVHVYTGAVAGTSGTHQARVDRQDVGVGQLVAERNLYRLAPLTDDDPAEVTLRRRATQILDRLEPPQCGRRQRRVQSVPVLGDIDRVVVDDEPAVEVLARTVGDSHWDPTRIERIHAAKGLQEPRRRWALDKTGCDAVRPATVVANASATPPAASTCPVGRHSGMPRPAPAATADTLRNPRRDRLASPEPALPAMSDSPDGQGTPGATSLVTRRPRMIVTPVGHPASAETHRGPLSPRIVTRGERPGGCANAPTRGNSSARR